VSAPNVTPASVFFMMALFFFLPCSPPRIYEHLTPAMEKHDNAYNISHSRNQSNVSPQNIGYLFLLVPFCITIRDFGSFRLNFSDDISNPVISPISPKILPTLHSIHEIGRVAKTSRLSSRLFFLFFFCFFFSFFFFVVFFLSFFFFFLTNVSWNRRNSALVITKINKLPRSIGRQRGAR